jgi:dolichol-phosphate mannosyltransferase
LSEALVVIPTYNEKENIERIIRTVFALHSDYHVLIVDDNSPDGTQEIVKHLQGEYEHKLFLLPRAGKQGLGTAYLAGFSWALKKDYQFIFEMDAETCKEEKFGMAIGSRYVKGVNVVNWPMSRVLLSYFASRYVRIILSIPVEDTTAGFVCFRREVLEKMNFKKIRFVGYAFQIEMKFITHKLGFKIKEVPVIFTDRTLGTSKMSSGIINEAVFGVLKLKLRSLLKRHQ